MHIPPTGWQWFLEVAGACWVKLVAKTMLQQKTLFASRFPQSPLVFQVWLEILINY